MIHVTGLMNSRYNLLVNIMRSMKINANVLMYGERTDSGLIICTRDISDSIQSEIAKTGKMVDDVLVEYDKQLDMLRNMLSVRKSENTWLFDSDNLIDDTSYIINSLSMHFGGRDGYTVRAEAMIDDRLITKYDEIDVEILIRKFYEIIGDR